MLGADAPERLTMDSNLKQLIFEACNDAMCAGIPMTPAMQQAFLESTGNRGKYPNALDSLARLALEPETRKSPTLCDRHGGYGFTSDCTECNTEAPNMELTGATHSGTSSERSERG